MAMLDDVKTALRIEHNVLNGEITEAIAAARAEMERAGVSNTKASSLTDPLVNLFIKTFCLSKFSPSEKTREGFETSWKYQLDAMRKSAEYSEEQEAAGGE